MTNYTTTNANINSADYRADAKPIADRARHIASLKRSIEALRAAGLPTTFYANALAALEGAAS